MTERVDIIGTYGVCQIDNFLRGQVCYNTAPGETRLPNPVYLESLEDDMSYRWTDPTGSHGPWTTRPDAVAGGQRYLAALANGRYLG